MKPKVSIGTQDFEKLRKNNSFYIDKTLFINEWWESQDDVTLITRPRRFGKTLNLNMLNCFFSNQYAGRSDLFEGLSIWEDEKYRPLQGSYPVIFLSFADIKGKTFEVTRNGIIQKLVKLFSTHAYVKDKKILNEEDWAYLCSVKVDMKDDVAALTVNYLSDYMRRYYGKKVLIFLDEYDTPMQEAYVNGYWDELTAFIRSLYITSNRESGFGRYDVVMEPKNPGDNAYILEFKVFNPKKEKNLEESVQNALNQIEKKKYDTELISKGIAKENIYHYGFAFEGKKVLIG